LRSPLAEALQQVGDRWSLLIVDALLDGPLRFGDLEEAVAGVAPNILSQRLKQLEHDGVVLSRRYSARPPRYAYELTGAGRDLAGALRLLTAWGARRTRGGAGPSEPAGPNEPASGPRHELCGTPLEARWYCPTCDVVANEDPEGDPGEGLRYL
jgi:DNA-binding HxlR family transcriptional regulator